MSDITQPAPLGPAQTTRVQRLAGRWWRRQSPARQDRFATLAPLASVLLFLAAIISAFWYLRNEEMERETESVRRDTEITQQQIVLRLIENQEQVYRIARELVSREIDPLEACVITVGAIQGGNKHNIVPGECHLQATVRSYAADVRERMLAAIERKAKAVALSYGAPPPKVVFSEHTPSLHNHVALTAAVRAGFVTTFGAAAVVDRKPEMIAEDFGRLYGENVPLCMFRLGTIAPERLAKMVAAGDVPALHSARYYPDYEVATWTGVRALVAAVQAAGAAKLDK